MRRGRRRIAHASMNSMDGVPDPDSGSRCPGAEDQGAVRLRAGDTELEAHDEHCAVKILLSLSLDFQHDFTSVMRYINGNGKKPLLGGATIKKKCKSVARVSIPSVLCDTEIVTNSNISHFY